MAYLVVDIETCAHPDAASWLEPVVPAGNLKDPVKIAASIAERTAERDDKLGLDPDLCRIVALGYHVIGHAEPECLLFSTEQEEQIGLGMFWSAYTTGTKLVTFYGHAFDLPVLVRRSLYLGVKHPEINLDRFKSPHIDLWQKLAVGYPPKAHSLAFYAKRFGFTTLDKVNGSDIAGLVKDGSKEAWDAIEAHCLSDVGLAHALANKLGVLIL